MQINILYFDVQYHASCGYDKLTIYGGVGVTSDIIWEGCDEESSFPSEGIEIITDFENITFVWITNDAIHLGGFEISIGRVLPTVEPTTEEITSRIYISTSTLYCSLLLKCIL